MSTDQTEGVRNAEVVPLHPDQERAAPEAPKVIYADITSAGERRPVIPPQWTRENFRATLNHHAGRHWHKARFHGIRSPLYFLRTILFALRGVHRLTGRIILWWHAPHLWALESQAVARKNHGEAMRAHTEGKKTRAKRGQILAVCAAVALVPVIAAVVFLPWWGWALASAVGVLVLARHGKPVGKPMIAPAVVEPQYEKLTPDIIIRALGALGIAGINQWITAGKEIAFIAPGVGRDGPGWRVAIDLPYGVTIGEIADRRDKLASGLRRPLGCVWPEGDEAHEGRLVLYVCDEPLNKIRQPAWTLARAGKADLFGPIPFGTDQRGRPVALLLMFANLLIGSIPRQGKTVAMRLVMLAAALDPITELHVWELKGTGDLSACAKVAHRYGSGADDGTIAAALDDLRHLAEVELVRRAKTIRELDKAVCPESKVTPELARKRSLRLHPVVFGIDECQEAFSHPQYGGQFARYAEQVIKRGPALGIMLVLATQKPDKASLPTAISSNVSMRFCLRVMDQIANDMILGTSAYKTGVRATLMTVSDKGCGYLVGAADAPQVVKTFNVQGPAADSIAARARAAREAAGTLSGHALGDAEAEARSFAADVLSVFGADPKLWCETIAARLAAAVPSYADITTEAVASQLRALGVEVKKVREAGKPPRAGAERSAVEVVAGALV